MKELNILREFGEIAKRGKELEEKNKQLVDLVKAYRSFVGNTGYSCRDNRDIAWRLWNRANEILGNNK